MTNDPYIYDNGVLKNNYKIKDEKELNQLDKDLSQIEITEILSWNLENEIIDYNFLKKIHHTMFRNLYPWAGEERTIGMSKKEEILNGESVKYGNPIKAQEYINYDISELNRIDWNSLSPKEKSKKLLKPLINMWEVHPFRDGNTRTILTFIEIFAKKNNFNIKLRDKKNIRNYFVLACKNGQTERLEKLIEECIV